MESLIRLNKHRKSFPTLRRRMVVQIGLMVLCALMIGLGAMVGINGLHEDMGATVQGYRELRQVYEVGLELSVAKDALSGDQPEKPRAVAALETAQLRLSPSYDQDPGETSLVWFDEANRSECAAPIAAAVAALNSPSGNAMPFIDDGLGRLAMLSGKIRTTIGGREERASERRRETMIFIAALSAVLVVLAMIVGMRQYRGVVQPLDRLARGARRFAAGHLSERIEPAADREFAMLADDFNHMAAELESVCKGLEEKVEAKSRELSRSQRLASVGFLAAGVAHEINNPLSIITGYGERSLRLLDRVIDESILTRTRSTIRIICEEAFRCKEITDRLLSLARPGIETPRRVSLASIAHEVVRNIGGLAQFADRRIDFDTEADADASVVANDGEMKQVMMNLLLNALDAIELDGHVEVRISRVEDEIELTVADDGKGMTPQTMERIFEPFYSEKRGETPGIGLGLSITHAIVERYGGRIRAQSDGPGCGSSFVVRLPAAAEGVCA